MMMHPDSSATASTPAKSPITARMCASIPTKKCCLVKDTQQPLKHFSLVPASRFNALRWRVDILLVMENASVPPAPKFEIEIYQIPDNNMFLRNRIDGTGWHWNWASWQRDWMDETPSRFAYRCLPLTIANQTGWVVNNPVGFTATWYGGQGRSVQFLFDRDQEMWSESINDQFGNGIVTWRAPFLFRTRPAGSRLLVTGPINSFKHAIQPMTAIMETDWMVMSFTMNWKFTASHQTVRFDAGEPIFQFIPLMNNICTDLQAASVTYMDLAEAPDMAYPYKAWMESRRQMMEKKISGEATIQDWQKDYFTGRNVQGSGAEQGHTTRINPPKVRYVGSVPRTGP